MHPWHIVFVGVLFLISGCAGLGGSGDTPSQLHLTVQNERAQPVPYHMTVTASDGTVIADESDRLASGVARSFDFTTRTGGRHEVTVAGDDWRGQLTWNADTCAQFDAVVRITDRELDVAGECTQFT